MPHFLSSTARFSAFDRPSGPWKSSGSVPMWLKRASVGGCGRLRWMAQAAGSCTRMASSGLGEPQAYRRLDTAARRREFMDALASKKGVSSPFHWRKVRAEDVRREAGGAGLLLRYQGSLLRALADIYPERQWTPVECEARLPASYWEEQSNRRLFLQHVAELHGLGNETEESEWKKVTTQSIMHVGGGPLLARFQHAEDPVVAALQDAFPEGGFSLLACRPHVPSAYWKPLERRRAFMDAVKEKFGVEQAKDWAQVGVKEVAGMQGGRSFLQYHGRCLLTALEQAYPQEEFFALECRPRVPNSFWQAQCNRRQALEWLAKRCEVATEDDWKKVTRQRVTQLGAGTLFKLYDSLFDALVDCFPERQWQRTAVRKELPLSHWQVDANVTQFIEQLRERLAIERKEEWFRVATAQIRREGGAGLLKRMGLTEALRLTYPGEEWDAVMTTKGAKKSAQRDIFLLLKRLLPSHVAVVEEHMHKGLGSDGRDGHKGLELDFYIPDFSLGIEYNGYHHYHELPHFGPVEVYRRRDEEKRKLCEQHGIRLVTIPYWWDGSLGQLSAALSDAVPGLLQHCAQHADSTQEAIPS